MKKKIFSFVIAICFAISLFTLTACTKTEFKINFVVDGEIVSTINTNGEEIIEMPANPIKEGFTFDGWYWDENTWKRPFTANSLLNEPLSRDMSVYAKFIDASSLNGTDLNISGFVAKDFETLGKCLYASFPNKTNIFLLNDLVEVNNKSKWTLSTDIGGVNIIPSKSVELEVGNNIFYIVVKDNNENVKPYTIVIRRKPIYEVSFNTNGGSQVDTQYIEEESFAQLPTEVVNKTGYAFSKWDFDFTKPILKDTLVTANWTPISYNITYNLNGGSATNVKNYNIETETFTLANPTKTGYIFIGWTYSGQEEPTKTVTINKGNIGDKEYTANWRPVEYTITINANGGNLIGNKTINYNIETPTFNLEEPTKVGYTFIGWINNVQEEPTKTITINKGSFGDKEYTAKWTPITYNIAYNLNGGIATNVKNYNIETETFTLVNPTKTGYIFIGWTYNGQEEPTKTVTINKGSIGDKVYTANWTPIEYTITYNLNKGSITGETTIYTIEDAVTFINPTREYYTFAGWYDNAKFIGEALTGLSIGNYENKEYFAKWIPIEYTITLDANSGSLTGNEIINYNIETPTFDLEIPTKAGYTFFGWYEDLQSLDSISKIEIGTSGNKTLHAKWQVNQNTLHFNGNGATSGNVLDMLVNTDEKTTLNANLFSRLGYTFIGWSTTNDGKVVYKDKASYTMGTNSECTLYAVWQANINTLHFNANTGTGAMQDMSIHTDEIKPLTANAFTKRGYKFIGWSITSDGNVDYIDSSDYKMGIESDYTLYAIWELVTYNITYNLNNGVINNNPLTYTLLDTIDLTKFIPTKNYYKFIEWQKDGEKIETITNSTGDITLTAIFTPIEFNINYELDGGDNNVNNPKTYNVEDTLVLSDPTKYGYEFIKWQIIESSSNGDITAVAIWELATYTITYNLDGGLNSKQNIDTFTLHSYFPFKLYDASKDNSIFDGWYLDANFTNKISEILECKNYVLYAKYIPSSKGFIFEQSSDGSYFKVVGYNSYDANETDLIVPSQHNGMPVTEIVKIDFPNITSLVLPSSIAKIATGAIGQCHKINKLTMPMVVDKIDYVFNGMLPSSLTEVVINGNIGIKSRAFDGCDSITKITLSEDIPILGSLAFNNCNNLQEITILSKSLDIYNDAFNGCKQLSKININDLSSLLNINYVDKYYFNPLSYDLYLKGELVTNLVIPKDMVQIKRNTFMGCKSIQKVVIPSSLTSIGAQAFRNCNSLTRVDITDLTAWLNITFDDVDANPLTYAHNLYLNNELVTNVVIPQEMSQIKAYVFSGCSNLTNVIIPSSVTTIGVGAFNNCNSLTRVDITDLIEWLHIDFGSESANPLTYAHNLYLNNELVTEVIYPQMMPEVKDYVFSGCSNITSVTIPSNVTSIGVSAFKGCSSLKEITLPMVMQHIGEIFEGYNQDNKTNNIPKSLRRIVINSGQIINTDAFSNCVNLLSLVIPTDIGRIEKNAFYNCHNLTLYCERAKKSGGWDFQWDNGIGDKVFSYESTTDHTYTFVSNGGTECSPITAKGLVSLPTPTKEGYIFDGWFCDVDCNIGKAKMDYWNSKDTTFYAKWLTKEEYYDGSSFDRAKTIVLNNSETVEIARAGQYRYYKFTPTETRNYMIEINNVYDSYHYVYDENQNQLWEQDYESYSRKFEGGKTYYIAIKLCDSSSTGTLNIKIM